MILAFELRKENNTGAENGKLLAACSGTGTHPIVVSKSCGVPPSRVLTTRGHWISETHPPSELSSNHYENIRKSLEPTLKIPTEC